MPSSWRPSAASPPSGPEGKGGALSEQPRFFNAGNAGPFTLDGTRTYLVGCRCVVVIDPGPDGARHLDALVEATAHADRVHVVLTHGHRDHAPAAFTLAERLGVDVRGPAGLPAVDHPLADGDVLATDEGSLVAVATPGHARHHLAFHWPERRALFAGDLLLGEGATTWVGEYAGCVGDYLASLERVRKLELEVIYPAHGPSLEDPPAAIARYQAHRLERIRQVQEALQNRPELEEEDLLGTLYGPDLDRAMHPAALLSVRALMEHVGYGRGDSPHT